MHFRYIFQGTTHKKLIREMLTPAQFFLGSVMEWSPWQLAIIPRQSRNICAKTFSPSSAGHNGLVDGTLFKDSCRSGRPTIYELAVTVPEKGSRYLVTYYKVKDTAKVVGSWERIILEKNQNVIRQINQVLDQNCQIHIRRSVLVKSLNFSCGSNVNSAESLRQVVRRCYDYAWCLRAVGKDSKHTRPFKHGRIDISSV